MITQKLFYRLDSLIGSVPLKSPGMILSQWFIIHWYRRGRDSMVDLFRSIFLLAFLYRR